MTTNLLLLLGSYLLGSIPTAYIIMKALTGQDLHHLGSGNIGATNLTKQLGKAWGAPVFLFDAAKGAVALLIARASGASESLALLCAFCAVAGHNFPLWLKFRGGKGVSTTLGVIAALNPLICLACLALWYLLFKLKGYVSLASLAALWLAPLLFLCLRSPAPALLCAALALLSTLRHRGNIARLKAGEEYNFKKKAQR